MLIVGFVNMWNTWDVNLGWRKFKHLSWNQVAELDHNGFEIGSHSIHHSDLTRLKDDLLNRELIESKQRLEDRLGKNTSFISYPFGKYNQKVIDLSKRAGYIRACGCLHRISFKEKNQESFVLERKAYYLFDGIWNLNAKMNHSLFAPIEQFKLRVVNFCSYGTSLVKPSKLEHYSKK